MSLDKLNVLNIVCKCPCLIHYFVLGIRAEFRLMKVVWRWWCYCSKIMKKKIHLYLDFNPLFPFSLLFIPCPKPRYNHMWSPFDFCMVSWLLIVLIWYMSKPMVMACMFWLVLNKIPTHFECLGCNICEGIGSCYIRFWWDYWV